MTISVTLPHAVFGPLSTGSDVRLLATTKGFKLPREAEDELSRFYFAGWKAARQQPGPYWAFFPLDHVHWGLAQAQVIGEGAVGTLFVVWLALLDADTRTRTGWQSHRLWRTAFPQPLLLPAPGSRVTPQPASLSDEPPSPVPAREEQLDTLAYAIDRANAEGRTARYAISKAVAESPAAALFATWQRLGSWAAERSYCTWGGIVEAGFTPRAGPFDVLVDAPGSRAATPVEKALAVPPTNQWLMLREEETGIGGPAPPVNDQSAKEIAAAWFELYEAKLVGQREFSLFLALAKRMPERAFALSELLRCTVAALPVEAGAEAVDRFVRETLPPLMENPPPSVAPPLRTVTMIALRHELVLRLNPATIRVLAPELLGDADSAVFVQQLLDSLAPPPTPPGAKEQAAGRAMLAILPEGVEQERLRDVLLGRLWRAAENGADPVLTRLSETATPEQALKTFSDIGMQVPAELHGHFSNAYLDPLTDRVIAPPEDGSDSAAWLWLDAMVQVGIKHDIVLAGHRLGSGAPL